MSRLLTTVSKFITSIAASGDAYIKEATVVELRLAVHRSHLLSEITSPIPNTFTKAAQRK